MFGVQTLKIDHGNPATIRLTYPKKYNEEVGGQKKKLYLERLPSKVNDGEYHGTGDVG